MLSLDSQMNNKHKIEIIIKIIKLYNYYIPKMHFCKKCSNMYYIRLDDENNHQLIYYCRKCGDEDTTITQENMCVSKVQLRRGEQRFSHIINEYTKLDPTLPRINSIRCPNTNCESNKNESKREVIFIRYDDVNVKYIYLCAVCNTSWKTDESH